MDTLIKSKHLKNTINRVEFDATNVDHLESLQHFLNTGRWGNVQFEIEFPYTNVVDAVMKKVTSTHISNIIDQLKVPITN